MKSEKSIKRIDLAGVWRGKCRKKLNVSWRKSEMMSPVVLAVHLTLNFKLDCFLVDYSYLANQESSNSINNSFQEAAHEQLCC